MLKTCKQYSLFVYLLTVNNLVKTPYSAELTD